MVTIQIARSLRVDWANEHYPSQQGRHYYCINHDWCLISFLQIRTLAKYLAALVTSRLHQNIYPSHQGRHYYRINQDWCLIFFLQIRTLAKSFSRSGDSTKTLPKPSRKTLLSYKSWLMFDLLTSNQVLQEIFSRSGDSTTPPKFIYIILNSLGTRILYFNLNCLSD